MTPGPTCRAAAGAVLMALCFAIASTSILAQTPPVTRIDPVVDTYFGHAVDDPYRWLESTASPEVLGWFREQAAHARAILDALPGRAAWRARIAELDVTDTNVRDVQYGGDEVFYLKRSPNEDAYKLYVRSGLNGAERMLIDPSRLAGGDETAGIDYFRASPNGRRIAVGVSTGGSEDATMHVFDVASGRSIAPSVPRARDAFPSWRFDSSVLFYRQLREPAVDAPVSELFRGSRAFARVFSSDGTTLDAPVLGQGLSPEVALAPDDAPSIVVSPISPYAIGSVTHGVERELSLYVVPLTQIRGTATPWRKLAGPEAGIVDFDLRGEWIYLVTHEDASRYRVTRWSLKDDAHYEGRRAEVVVPESDRVIAAIGVAKDALYVQQQEAGIAKLLRLEFNVNLRKEPPTSLARSATAKPRGAASRREPRPASLPKTAGVARGREIALPYAGSIQELVIDPLRSGALSRLAGWTQAPAYWLVDGKTGTLSRTALLPPARADFSAITSTMANVPSFDGTLVPLSIVHRRDLARNGTAPLLIEAYGAYGFVDEPVFSPTLLAWLERGGIYAIAHVRGGGYFGRAWHLAGRGADKPNSWRDLIACAEFAVRDGWTSPSRMAVIGQSAGALVAANAAMSRPELFGALVSVAGFHDALRSETGAAGPANASEFGSVATEEGVRALLAMSAYAKVERGRRYPASLFIAGFNDLRVDPWDPGKMAARLQDANSAPGGSGRPALLRVDFTAGHGATATRAQGADEWADVFAFLEAELGGESSATAPPNVKASQPD